MDIKSVTKDYVECASGGTVTAPFNGSWISAYAIALGATEIENGSWLQTLCEQLGITQPVNSSWVIALANYYGISQPVNGSWWYAIADNACNGGIAPTADFSALPLSLSAGNDVQYTDLSTDNGGAPITQWSWAFAGGTPATSSAQNPLITYNTPGVYDAELTVTSNDGSDGELKSNYINVTAAFPSGLLFAVDPATAPVGTTVPDASGNGNNGTLTNVTHDGTYYKFAGSGDNRIEWGDIGDPLSDVTIIQWINVADTNRRSFMFKWNDTIGGAGNRSIANEQNGGNWNNYLSTNGGWQGVGASVTQPGASVWAMMALTYNATTGLQTMTVGDPITSYNSYGTGTASPALGNPFDSASPWTFGVQPFSTSFNDPFSGSLGHVYVFKNLLTTTEVQGIWNSTKSYY